MLMATVKEYAAKMASSESQIRAMCAKGIIPSVKIGKGYKIDVEKADEYFRERIDERLTQAQRQEEVRMVKQHSKRRTGESYIDKINKILKEGVGKKHEQEPLCEMP